MEYPLWQQPDSGIRWFARDDVLARDDQRSWLWVRARTSAALTAALEDLPGDWTVLADD
jgi:hypothetical protein